MNRVFILSLSSIRAESVQPWVQYYIQSMATIASHIIVHADKNLIDKLQAEIRKTVIWQETSRCTFKDWQTSILDICSQKASDQYEEIVLCDDSVYGPLFSLADTFDTMKKRGFDFWSATFSNIEKEDGSVMRIPETSMMVLKAGLFFKPQIQQFWAAMDATVPSSQLLESMMNILSELRCKSGYLMKEEKYCDISEPLKASHEYAHELVGDKLPFVNRSIFADTSVTAKDCIGGMAAKTLQAIKSGTDYPVDFIWDDILSSHKMSDIKVTLHLNYILGNTTSGSSTSTDDSKDIALICYVYYKDLCPYMCRYLASMPKAAHICIISSNSPTLEAYKTALNSLGFRNVDYRLKPNRGRDVAALLVTARDVVEQHEYVCFVHDKKSKHFQRMVAEGHLYHCMECCLHNGAYVENIINLFNKEQFCGLLVPPTVNFGPYNVMGYEQGMNAASMQQAYDMLKLNCPMDDAPVTSFGTCFWARSKALVSMYNYAWDYADFPDEPMPPDQTLSHGLERIFPIAAQNSGFYTAWVSPSEYAEYYMNDLAYKFSEYNKLLFKRFGYQPWANMLTLLDAPHGDNSNNFIKASDIIAYLKRKYKIRKAIYFIVNVLTLGIFRKKYRKKLRHLKEKIRGIKQGENVQL